MITVTLTNPRHIAAAHAAWLATPDRPEAVGQYVQAAIERVAESWAESTGVDRIPVSAFVRRFPGAAMDAINAAALSNPTVAAILAQIDAVQTVRLGHPTTTQGVGYLVSVGLLTQAEADVVVPYEVPSVP